MKIIKKTMLILIIFVLSLLSIIVQMNNKVYGIELNEQSKTITFIESVSKNLIGDVSVNTVEYLYNLDDSPDYIYVKYKNNGYAVFSSNTLNILEYSLKGDLPYPELNKKYYAGPTNYINKINGNYKNISTNEYITDQKESIVEETKYVLAKQEIQNFDLINNNELSIINEELLENKHTKVFNNASTTILTEETIQDELITEPVYIENYEYFMIGPYHGMNITGTCNAVAAQILLGFHNYYNDRRIIDEKYLFDGEDNPNKCQNPMKISSKIIGTRGINEYATNDENNYFAKIVSKIPASTTGRVVEDGINELLDEREAEIKIELESEVNIDLGSATRGTDLSVIKSEIDANRPIIIHMRTGASANHSVVGYGYQSLNATNIEGNDTFGYVVHCGYGYDNHWNNKSSVWINKDWCYGWVKMETTHTHSYNSPDGDYYEKKCECGHRKSEFPFETEEINGKIKITAANFLAPSDFIIPSKINRMPVTSISSNVFKNNYRINNLTIPNTIETIEEGSFSGCRSLESITIPFVGGSRNAINNSACLGYIFGKSQYAGSEPIIQNGQTYYFPNNLTSVIITDTPKINDNAFENCKSLVKIYLFGGLKTIGNNSFYGCSGLKLINIPNTVTSIGNNAFKNCAFTEPITIPNSITHIGEEAFDSNVLIKWIYNPSVTASSLGITDNLDIVSVETGVNNITTNAFSNCTYLTTVELYSDVTSIDQSAFEGCISLSEVIWYYNSSYRVIDIGGNLNEILTTIKFPSGITEIDEEAFKDCKKINNVKIPDTVEAIGPRSFENCDNLSNIIITKDTYPITSIAYDTFYESNALTTIKVPTEKFFIYKYDQGYTSFKDMIVPNDDFESEELDGLTLNKTYFIEPERNVLREININYDYIYSFNVEGDEELNIKFYDENYLFVASIPFNSNENKYNYETYLEEGIYYIDMYYLDYTKSGNINLSIEFSEEYDLYFNTEDTVSNYLVQHGTNYISFLKYNHLENNGLYKISINNISNSNLEEGIVTIYTDKERTNILESYNITDFSNEAITKTGDNTLYVYLYKNTTYYITIKLNDNYQNVKFKIENLLSSEFTIFNQSRPLSSESVAILSLQENIDNSSYFKKLIIKEKGFLSTNVTYEGTQSDDIKVLFIKEDIDNNYINLNIFTLNSSNKTKYISHRVLDHGTYYIGYYNLDKSKCTNLNVSLSRFVDNGEDSVYDVLYTDPNSSGMYGTQISIVERTEEEKSFGETFITKGFTRLVFIDSTYGYSNSRLDYEWYSSNEDVLKVTQYGTVLGKSVGTAKIIGVNKNNPSIIFIKEFTVIDNTNILTHTIEIEQTYSLSSDEELYINLTSNNCPYPMIQYYNFEVIQGSDNATINPFGKVTVNTCESIVILGTYTLNENYRIKITINVVE